LTHRLDGFADAEIEGLDLLPTHGTRTVGNPDELQRPRRQSTTKPIGHEIHPQSVPMSRGKLDKNRLPLADL
jgi:hypothetical protein